MGNYNLEYITYNLSIEINENTGRNDIYLKSANIEDTNKYISDKTICQNLKRDTSMSFT